MATGVNLQLAKRWALAVAWGVLAAVTVGVQFLDRPIFTAIDRTFLLVVPALALMLTAYAVSDPLRAWLEGRTRLVRLALFGLASVAAATVTLTTQWRSPVLAACGYLATAPVLLFVLAPAGEALESALLRWGHRPLLAAWMLAVTVAGLVAAIMALVGDSLIPIVLAGALMPVALGACLHHAILASVQRPDRSLDTRVALVLLFLLILGLAGVLLIGMRYAIAFPGRGVLLDGREFAAFLTPSLLALPWMCALIPSLERGWPAPSAPRSAVWALVGRHLPGLGLALLFFTIYLLVGGFLNQERFDVDDIFFDADAFIWRYRLTTPNWPDFYWRSVHPLALPMLRPPVGLIAGLLGADASTAVTLLASIGGATCVFLAWLFLRRALQESSVALLGAALLGASASHFIFGGMMETYVFLTAGSLAFLALLQRAPLHFGGAVGAGLAVSGLTVTNFAQTLIPLAVVRPRLRLLLRYAITVAVLLVALGLIANVFYPDAVPMFFLPSGYAAEQENIWAGSPNRALAMARSIALYSLAAPRPIVTYGDIPLPQFRYYRAESGRMAEYEDLLPTLAAWTWLTLLVAAVASLPFAIRGANGRFVFALVLSTAFNAFLHIRYGKEFFLYSANWTYAVVLAVVLSLEWLLRRTTGRALLLAIVAVLLASDLYLWDFLLKTTLPYFR